MRKNSSTSQTKTRPEIQIEAERLIADFNNERGRRSTIPEDTGTVFNVISILARKEHLKEMNDPESYNYLHTRREYIKYQNDLANIIELLAENGVREVIIIGRRGQQVRLKSRLLVHSLIEQLPRHHAKRSRGGRPEDVTIEFCRKQVEALLKSGVPIAFIGELFDKTPKAVKQALRRVGTKHPRNLA